VPRFLVQLGGKGKQSMMRANQYNYILSLRMFSKNIFLRTFSGELSKYYFEWIILVGMFCKLPYSSM